jgi:DNA-binding transcriptional LysR family regulator
LVDVPPLWHIESNMARKLDLNLLQTLEALLAERNVTRAAARLNTTQPALSAQLARLRQMFDDPLLIPSSRGMTPTPRALELEPLLGELMSGLRAVVHPQRFDPATSEATILIAATDSVHYIVAPFLAELHRAAPHIRIADMPVTRLSKPEIERSLASGQLDIVIGLVALFPDDLRIREVSQDEYVCVMRQDHPFKKDTLGLDDFCAFEHVFMSPLGGEFSGDVDEALRELGRERQVIASVPSALVAARILETSDFVAVFPQYLARRESPRLKFYPLPVTVGKLKLSMAWHERTHLNPAHQWFRERIISIIRRIGQGDPPPAAQGKSFEAPENSPTDSRQAG